LVMEKKHFLAIDLGATSGRSIIGTLENGILNTAELTRFPNRILEIHGKYYWNIYSLFEQLRDSLSECSKRGIKIESLGIDSWGVDFVMLTSDDKILSLPRAYRDPYTHEIPKEFFNRVLSKDELYNTTGIQVMDFNTIYQLYAMQRAGDRTLKAAHHLLFIPDALNFLLTGNKTTEYTVASTSQLLNVYSRTFDQNLLEKIGLNEDVFPKIVQPAEVIGQLTNSLAEETGLGKIPVVAVAGHDTASAIAALPVEDQEYAYISSGTWSLLGIEVNDPIINSKAAMLNFTNEGGVNNTIRFLKNITGLWLLECCLKEWAREGREYSYKDIVNMISSKSFHCFIDPDDPSFSYPKSMTQSIKTYCREHGFEIPQGDGEIVRCIFESLAMKYKYVIDRLNEFAPNSIKRLHIIGGGANNSMLNQFASNSTGLEVIAGPAEATSIGNIILQAIAVGELKDLADARRVIKNSIEVKSYYPSNVEAWQNAYKVFMQKCMNKIK
jgi:rhamnulokinase